jgi:hypothetical protein
MQSKPITWSIAWDYPAFRIKLLVGVIIMLAIISSSQTFFTFVQARHGVLVDDMVLNYIPAYNVSPFIFLIIYPLTLFMFWRMKQNSEICITFLYGYLFLCLVRMGTITLFPLEAPKHLVHLVDPFTTFFYGTKEVTKDLFFSGHTATVFFVGLCLENKREKIIAFIATAVLAILLLVQHIHYTADIIAAPFFCYLFWYLGKTVARL